jgi:hypothetical protein
MKSPVPYYSDAQYAKLNGAERSLLVAARECDVLKVREVGNNRGSDVEKYLRYVGLGGGYAWCAAFVSWCMSEADWPKFRSARVSEFVAWGRRTGRILKKPVRGCLFASLNPDGTGHIGFVTAVLLGVFKTIEGNTNDEGSREGYEVARRTRSGAKYIFIDIRW